LNFNPDLFIQRNYSEILSKKTFHTFGLQSQQKIWQAGSCEAGGAKNRANVLGLLYQSCQFIGHFGFRNLFENRGKFHWMSDLALNS
jgi:hypothetical protein